MSGTDETQPEPRPASEATDGAAPASAAPATGAPGPEPSMEEILASIRRMLNEPDEGEDRAADGHDGAAEEVFQLDESMLVAAPIQAPEAEEPALSETFEKRPESTQSLLPPEGPLMHPEAASAAAQSLGSLRRALGERQAGLGRGGLTLEEIVREELRPLLQAWLDNHLPALIERTVQAEIARLAQRG